MTVRAAQGAPSPLNQHDLRRAVNRDRCLSACDRACVGEIIDWHHNDYGNAWICYDILVDKTGFSRSQVIRSVKRLRATGYIELLAKGARGVGRKGRDGDKGRGGLSLGCKKQNTNNLAAKNSVMDDTSNVKICSVMDDTSNQKCSVMDDTHSYLQDGPTRDRPTVGMYPNGEGARGAASQPPLAPLAGAAAGTPRDPVAESFKELWTAYAFKHDPQKAKAAYHLKLNPDATLHAEMVTAASAWASAYNDNGTEPEYRKRLHNWIGEEQWLADPRLPHTDRKAAAIANKRGGRAKAKPPAAAEVAPVPANGRNGKAADHRKPSRTAPPKVRDKPKCKPTGDFRPVKPGNSSTQIWLRRHVVGGTLSVLDLNNHLRVAGRNAACPDEG